MNFGQEAWWYKLWIDNYFTAWEDVNGKYWFSKYWIKFSLSIFSEVTLYSSAERENFQSTIP
jgi:hypothetical protein